MNGGQRSGRPESLCTLRRPLWVDALCGLALFVYCVVIAFVLSWWLG